MRILAVEDDRDLLELTGAVLGQHGAIRCASDPAQALRLIAAERFDLLVTDLAIAGAGDGLILAGAMRYLQPRARTVLITGFPDYKRALLAMQGMLNMVLLKPVEIETLRDLPRLATANPQGGARAPGRSSLWALLDSKKTEILSSWLRLVEQDPELSKIPLSSSDRLDHMDEIVTALARSGSPAAAAEHGHLRRVQAYRAEWLAKEISLLRRVIFDAILGGLLALDLSALATQIFEMDQALDTELLDSLRAFGLLKPRSGN